MNIEDSEHDDCFKHANIYAADKVDLISEIKKCTTREQVKWRIKNVQDKYLDLFEAFIAGVDHGRKNARVKNTDDEIPF